MAPGRQWNFLRSLFTLGALASLAMFFVEYVYLPQRNLIDEQQTTISYLKRELQVVRGSRQEKDGNFSRQSKLERRVALLEKIMRSHDAEAAKELDKFLLTADGSRSSGSNSSNHSPAAGAAGTTAQAPKQTEAPKKNQSGSHHSLLEDAFSWAFGGKTTPPESKEKEKEKSESAKKKKEKKPSVRWRSDDRCGTKTPGDEGQTIGCNPQGKYPCCSPAGWCGDSSNHCSCDGCVDYRKGAPYDPWQEDYDRERPKSIALVVPFRDRGTHLERFRERIEELVETWNQKDVKHYWMVFVVEQFDNELFNRGWLFNVGFKYAMDLSKKNSMSFDCVVMHDVDILPTPVVDYGWCLYPNQLSGEIECWQNSVPYQDSTGGVISMSPEHWKKINGFSNEYQGWGGEDDDLYLRLKQNSLLRGGCHTFCSQKNQIPMVVRPRLGEGRFTCLNDGDHTPRQRNHNDGPMWARLNQMKGGSPRWKNDGVSSLKIHTAGPALQSAACSSECEAPEDPTPRKRRFAEHWSRVSLKPIAEAGRIHVVLPDGHASGPCSVDSTRPLTTYPVGLAHLRRLLPEIFRDPSCGVSEDWAESANFVLLDTTNGLSIMAGTGAAVILADSALAPITLADKEASWTYRRGKDGESQCTAGMTALTEHECREMPTHFHGTFENVISKPDYPAGCFHCSVCDGGQILFNTNTKGNGKSGRRPICKEPKKEEVEKEYVVQGQRLGRWIRRLPDSHHGWIMVTWDPALPDLRESMVKTGHRHAQTVPVCIGTSDYQSRTKYKATVGSVWCGDQGWRSGENFLVLRSKTSVRKEKLIPICISYRKDDHVYRFENSATGCVGEHRQSKTYWQHVTTMYTSRDARGEFLCVGVMHNGQRTHWSMRKAGDCTKDGFQHSFSFRAMTKNFDPAFVPACLQRGPNKTLRLKAGDADQACSLTKAADGYVFVRDVLMLRRPQDKSDIALCTSEANVAREQPSSSKGSSHGPDSSDELDTDGGSGRALADSMDLEGGSGMPPGMQLGPEAAELMQKAGASAELMQQAGATANSLRKRRFWRLFRDDDCNTESRSIREVGKDGEQKVKWLRTSSVFYLPKNASGARLCLCRPAASDRKVLETLQFIIRAENCTGDFQKEEFCFNTLSATESIQASFLVDEPV